MVTGVKSRIGSVLRRVLPINRRTFDVLRHELRALGTTVGNALNPSHHCIVARLRRRRELSINLASGGRGLKGWVNVELRPAADTTICLDIRRRLPFADGSARRIFAEHVVEHLDFREDVPRLFAEFHRILAPGGVVRIVVPDAGRFLEAYAKRDNDLWKALGWDLQALPDDIHTAMHAVNHIFHQSGEHLFAYDFETVAYALQRAGFREVHQRACGLSGDEKLAIDQIHHAPYSLYAEAVR